MATILQGDFEWDEAKARRNLKQHEVSFLEASTVFDDPLAISERSQKHSVGENRYVIIGTSHTQRLLAVAYTIREHTRIISARRLTARERRNYENQTEKQ